MNKEGLIKFYDFIVIVTAILAVIGGTAYLFYYKQPLFGVANLALSAMALPYIISRAKDILE